MRNGRHLHADTSEPNLASQSGGALQQSPLNTACSSPGELEMKPSTSDVAVCSSSASVQFASRASSLLFQLVTSALEVLLLPSPGTRGYGSAVLTFVLVELRCERAVGSSPLCYTSSTCRHSPVPFRSASQGSSPINLNKPHDDARRFTRHLVGRPERARHGGCRAPWRS